MIIDRRKFVCTVGIGTIAAAAAPAAELFGETIETRQEPRLQGGTGVPGTGSPLTAKRWAMVVDTRRATPELVQMAIEACHREHNVPNLAGTKDEIKWAWSEHFDHAFFDQDLEYLPEHLKQTPTLLLCNHCDNPPCVRVCPTEATWKRDDGIVMMDWHRCIGCRYCIVACPYGSRSFNFRNPRPYIEHINPDYPTRMRGVVEKCTFCAERLVKGELPFCVEATAGSGMLTFGDLEDAQSEVSVLVRRHFSIRRKPALGTQPEVYYIVPEMEETEPGATVTSGRNSHD